MYYIFVYKVQFISDIDSDFEGNSSLILIFIRRLQSGDMIFAS